MRMSDNKLNQPFIEDPAVFAAELGEAMRMGQWQMLLDRLDAYEVNVLRVGISAPEITKDWLSGFVACVRQLTADMRTAQGYAVEADRTAKLRAERQEREALRGDFRPPGHGPGGVA
jgi:hypothetical protein